MKSSAPYFYGTYQIAERIDKVAYHLDLPQGTRIHPVFHVSLLKKAISPAALLQPLPPVLTEELEVQVEPDAVKAVRTNPAGNIQVLIHWKELPDFEASWDSYDSIDQQFPQFHLADKVKVLGGVLLVGHQLDKYMSNASPN